MWSPNVECRFFISEAEDYYRADLEEIRKSSGGRVVYRNFSRDDFDTAVATDYVIINANPERRVADMPPRHMFLRVPINNEEYWITVDDKAAERFTDRFNKLWEKGQPVESAAASTA